MIVKAIESINEKEGYKRDINKIPIYNQNN